MKSLRRALLLLGMLDAIGIATCKYFKQPLQCSEIGDVCSHTSSWDECRNLNCCWRPLENAGRSPYCYYKMNSTKRVQRPFCRDIDDVLQIPAYYPAIVCHNKKYKGPDRIQCLSPERDEDIYNNFYERFQFKERCLDAGCCFDVHVYWKFPWCYKAFDSPEFLEKLKTRNNTISQDNLKPAQVTG